MRWWVSLFAVLGVLAHAHAIVRHNGMMLGDAMPSRAALGVAVSAASSQPGPIDEASALERDLQVLCGLAQANGDGSPPTGNAKHCPICSGLASAFALVPSLETVAVSPRRPAHDVFAALDQRVAVQRRLRPPSRAPPT